MVLEFSYGVRSGKYKIMHVFSFPWENIQDETTCIRTCAIYLRCSKHSPNKLAALWSACPPAIHVCFWWLLKVIWKTPEYIGDDWIINHELSWNRNALRQTNRFLFFLWKYILSHCQGSFFCRLHNCWAVHCRVSSGAGFFFDCGYNRVYLPTDWLYHGYKPNWWEFPTDYLELIFRH